MDGWAGNHKPDFALSFHSAQYAGSRNNYTRHLVASILEPTRMQGGYREVSAKCLKLAMQRNARQAAYCALRPFCV